MAVPFKSYRTASGKSVQQILEQYGTRAGISLGRQLYREATGIIEAGRQITPVDTSTLRAAEGVAEPVRDGDHIVVELGVGGAAGDKINPQTGQAASSYALFVHENLEAFHPVGSAKFIELPFNQAKAGMGSRIAKGMRDEMKAGGPINPTQAVGDSEGGEGNGGS